MKLKCKQNTHKIPKYTHNNYLIKILTKSRAAKLILAVNSRNEFQMRHATRHQHLLGRPKHKHTHTHRNEYLNVPIPMHTDRDTNAQAQSLCSSSRIAYRKEHVQYSSIQITLVHRGLYPICLSYCLHFTKVKTEGILYLCILINEYK